MLFKRVKKHSNDNDGNIQLRQQVRSKADRGAPSTPRRSYRSSIRRCLPWFLFLGFFQTMLFMFIGTIADLDNKPLHLSPFDRLGRRSQQKHSQGEAGENNNDNGNQQQPTPLDNYTSRRHIISKKSILIVGGSDGSGTRSFVDILGRVGVPMILDDGGTLDVHAQALYHGKGWPPLIQAILNVTHSANYEWDELPSELRETVTIEMENFNKVYMKRGEALLKKFENMTLAKHISFGFKAPATMLLLPMLRHVYGSIKFLHVVRDGRDVSFSDNVSPVQKFYDTYYTDFHDRRALYDKPAVNESFKEVLQMQLWNDWNTQVHEWAQAHCDGETFDYLVMRTEDLVDPESKLAALAQLSDFVGSPKTNEELCCLSRRPLADMGKSTSKYGNRASLLDQLRRNRLKLPERNRVGNHDPDLFAKLQNDRDRLQGLSSPHDTAAHSPDQLLRASVIQRKLLEQHPIKDDIKSAEGAKSGQQQKQGNEKEASSPTGGKQGSDPNGTNNAQSRPIETEKKIVAGGENVKPLLEETGGRNTRTDRENRLLSKYTDEAKRKAVEEMLKRRKEVTIRRKESPEQVKSRYGKWLERLEGKPELSRLLHEHGAAGLRLFGYEPRTHFMDTPITEINCDESIVCADS